MSRPSRGMLAVGSVLAIILVVGLPRLKLNVDVFPLLPADSEIVDGLKRYQRSFGSSRGLVISIRGPDADTSERAAGALAEALERSPLSASVVWRGPKGNEALAALVAYLWFNQPPERFAALIERVRDSRRERLELTLEQMATSLRPEDIARLARDPYDLTGILGDEAGALVGEGVGSPFASADGRLRILFVEPPFAETGFIRLRRWTEQVGQLADRWHRESELGEGVTLRLTGNPAFVAEFGSGLLHDMGWAALGTLTLVAILFWFAHRDWRPLARLVVVLVTVLAVTAALGALVFSELNIVSLGFAAILLGLAADYGLILYQERKSHPGKAAADHRRAVAPGILWAAATTSSAFLMLTRSSLPGLTQLGTLVAIGILVAAVLMLIGFLAARPPRAHHERLEGDAVAGAAMAGFWSSRLALVVTLVVLAASLAVLVTRGLPSIDYGTKELGPKASAARTAWTEIEGEIGGLEDALWFIVEGETVTDVGDRLRKARALLEEATDGGLLTGYRLPLDFWPKPSSQRANRAALPGLIALLAPARQAALAAGFTPASLGLTEAVFESWGRLASTKDVVWPQGESIDWMLRQFIARNGQGYVVLGRLDAAQNASSTELASFAQALRSSAQAELVGWSLLSESLLGVLERDLQRVLVPMTVVLIVLLGGTFRRVGEVGLSLVTLGVSLLMLLAVMSLAGWTWNLMNMMALALLLGAGVDYSIHVQLALRREAGDASRMRRTVGQAILLCAVSTAAGFGTLGFASNAGLASLGRVCATGIILAGMVSVFLLPAWWQSLPRRSLGAEGS